MSLATANLPVHSPLLVAPAIDRMLRSAVFLQALGLCDWLVRVQETPLLHFLWGDAELGGLGLSEPLCLHLQTVVGWTVLAAGAVAIRWPRAAPLLVILAVQAALTLAMCWTGEGYQIAPGTVPAWLAACLPLVTQAARLALPLSCWWFADGLRRNSRDSMNWALECGRWATAITFAAHGTEALLHEPEFVDMLLVAGRNTLGWSAPQSIAEGLLSVIGLADLLVAALSATTRFPAVAAYMATWGGVTALARVVCYGWLSGGWAALTRVSHIVLPLAVAAWWLMVDELPSQRVNLEENSGAGN